MAHFHVAQVNIGRIGMLQGPWNAALLDELGSFPLGQHDDQVDALALAFNTVAARRPMRINPAVLREFGYAPRMMW